MHMCFLGCVHVFSQQHSHNLLYNDTDYFPQMLNKGESWKYAVRKFAWTTRSWVWHAHTEQPWWGTRVWNLMWYHYTEKKNLQDRPPSVLSVLWLFPVEEFMCTNLRNDKFSGQSKFTAFTGDKQKLKSALKRVWWIDWLIDWLIYWLIDRLIDWWFYATFNSISVISRRQFTLFMSILGFTSTSLGLWSVLPKDTKRVWIILDIQRMLNTRVFILYSLYFEIRFPTG